MLWVTLVYMVSVIYSSFNFVWWDLLLYITNSYKFEAAITFCLLQWCILHQVVSKVEIYQWNNAYCCTYYVFVPWALLWLNREHAPSAIETFVYFEILLQDVWFSMRHKFMFIITTEYIFILIAVLKFYRNVIDITWLPAFSTVNIIL